MKKAILFLSLFIIGLLVNAQTLPPGVSLPDNISDAECFSLPAGFAWDIGKKYQSAINPSSSRVQSYANLLVGDMDGDGKPEILTLNMFTNSMYSNFILIFNNDLTLKKSYTCSFIRNLCYSSFSHR